MAPYRKLGGDRPAVAIRSSATAEDLPELSFAGQQETYLNVRGEAEVLAAVKRCWASLWTERALSYRLQHSVASQTVRLAVVVQRMVPADAAGVMFTVDPVSGVSDRVLINAAWVLGEAVVAGRVTPDTLVVDKLSGAVLTAKVSDKSVHNVVAPTGTHDVPVPERRRPAERHPTGRSLERQPRRRCTVDPGQHRGVGA
jgi:pyruvate,water dikinase